MTGFVVERLSASPPGSVDRVRAVVAGVRLLGLRSLNGRKYPPAVLAAAAPLFEGAAVNLGHHSDPGTGVPTEVPPDRRFGRVGNARAGAGGLFGDLRFNAAHPFAAPFLWASENAPDQYAFSPLMRVRWHPARDADGDLVAASILEVACVDVVADGGTNASVFESASRPAPVPPPPVSPALAAAIARAEAGHTTAEFLAAARRTPSVRELVAGYPG